MLEYNSKGERVRQWGSAGTGPGQFNQPHGIAVDDQGIIYVADRNNARLQRFDLNGKYLGEWNHLGKVTAVAFRDGALWIGTQYRNVPNEADGWHMKIDRKTGKILELTESGRSHHVLNINKSGELLSGARPDIAWWFHKQIDKIPPRLAFTQSLKRRGCEPGHFRVIAFGGFAQLLYSTLHVTLGRKNRSQVQSRASEIRAQPNGLLILRSRFGQLSLSCKKAAQ